MKEACPGFDRLSACLDGEFSGEVEAHLRDCPSCKGRYEDARQFRLQLLSISSPALEESFWQSLRVKLAGQRRMPVLVPFFRLAPGFAMAAVFLLIFVFNTGKKNFCCAPVLSSIASFSPESLLKEPVAFALKSVPEAAPDIRLVSRLKPRAGRRKHKDIMKYGLQTADLEIQNPKSKLRVPQIPLMQEMVLRMDLQTELTPSDVSVEVKLEGKIHRQVLSWEGEISSPASKTLFFPVTVLADKNHKADVFVKTKAKKTQFTYEFQSGPVKTSKESGSMKNRPGTMMVFQETQPQKDMILKDGVNVHLSSGVVSFSPISIENAFKMPNPQGSVEIVLGRNESVDATEFQMVAF